MKERIVLLILVASLLFTMGISKVNCSFFTPDDPMDEESTVRK